MTLKPPTKKDLTAFPANDNHEEPDEVWNISAPKKNSLFWSILIPYLIKSVENGTFRQNIKLLIDEKLKNLNKELNFDVIEKRVKNINPFKNIHTLYFDENLSTLMRMLKKKLNQMAGNLLNNSEGNYRKLEAAANMLMCNIDLYEEDSNRKSLKSFISPSSSQKGTRLKIIIFSQVEPSSVIYGFGLSRNYSSNLQTNSLKHIFKTAGLQQTVISDIIKLLPCEHLLITLIESSFGHVILTLFKSPYILKKLSDAGYDLNPLTTGVNGVSAFYYCILLNDWNLFRVLYNQASRKDYFHQEIAPEDDILKKLTAIHERIYNDFRFKGFSNTSQRMYDLLMRFNEYHIEIERGVTSIGHDSKAQASEKLTKTMLFIIDKYSEYFHYMNAKTELDKYEDFLQNYEYHRIVDDLTCLCFFDHFLSLKVEINEQNKNIFIEVLAALFLYFLSKLKFDRDIFFSDFVNYKTETKAKYFVIFCYRMRWYKALSSLSKELSRGLPELKDSNIIKIVENCLSDYPLIKEEFSLARLQMYLKISEEVDFSGNEIKSALAVLRTLQVIGETFRSSKKGNIITPLLEYCIPSNVVKVLRNIRDNCLSHLHASFTQGRKELEQQSSFLLEIQKELKDVAEAFEPIFVMQIFRVREFMITYGIEESKKYDNDLFKKLNDMKTEIYDLKQEHYGNQEDKYISISSTMIDLIPENNQIKYDRLQVHCEGLKYLLSFMFKHSNHCDIDDFSQEVDKIDNLYLDGKHEDLSKDSIKAIIDVFSELKLIFISKFGETQRNSTVKPFPNLNVIFKTVMECEIFSPTDQTIIRKSFSEFLDKAKQQIIDHVNGTQSSTEFDEYLKYLIEEKKVRIQIKQCRQNTDAALNILNNNSRSVEDILGKKEETCFKLMTALSNDIYRNAIPNLCLTKSIHDKLNDLKTQKLDFLLGRMKYLEEILINDNDYLKKSRIYGTSLEYRDHTKRLLMLRYTEEMDTKAALEMLLLDCLEILKKKDAFKNLWLKSTDLFFGINIRHTLSHGCPILEVSNDLLDANNLPMEFINIALELIEDQKALKALCEISRKTGFQGKELQLFVENNLDDRFPDLKKTFLQSETWERYLFLFSN